jgi:hypothetical protein
VLEDIGGKKLVYLYDFGDGWEHTIKVERLADPEPGALYPRLIEVSGRCPPEDCGGPWGYAELIEAIKDPGHERHAELTEWIGDDFDPNAEDAEGLTAHALAASWSPKISGQAHQTRVICVARSVGRDHSACDTRRVRPVPARARNGWQGRIGAGWRRCAERASRGGRGDLA